ncbi:Caffeyl-CoA reductase-Etf complex subunit CarC [Paraburkholderia caffeinitolerans]|uniref:Medium-chain specific acyl-CoA dehydrogenase, mitochondrial n=1 Tax=Paraburkholderia caffeinitolerans TaxID=1723730 RepID=A0A6J5G6M9_9BURK|nr:acyl-CoA dehydrogenase [Paraburkholderia caffeinitolerans]CAB3790938.1 Caffeyl-CoA reductase-Etf complex subunit CarC [Paraburkholderia caffeinitolerans]
MNFDVPSEWVDFGDALIRFVDREVAGLEQEHRALLGSERTLYGEDGRYSPAVLALRRQVRMRSAELGFYTALADESLGGGGLGAQAAVYIQERLNAHCGPGRHLVQTVVLPSPFTNGLSPVLRHLDPAVLATCHAALASGDKTMCFGLSEPDAGSDVFGMRTRAVRDGDHWVINGSKQWITNAPYADYAMIFAVTDEEKARAHRGGITGFFLRTDTRGFSVPGVIPVMGHLGAEIGIVALDNVRVPDAQRLGPVDRGLSVALDGVNAGRLSMAASCLGLARWALDQALAYAQVRKTFGQPIAEHQAVQFMLAECAMDIYASKSMIRHCAWLIDESRPATKEVSIVKASATEMVGRVMDRAIQIHGGMGLTNELRLEAGYRWARTMRIPDGTSEIQRRTIARRLLEGDATF